MAASALRLLIFALLSGFALSQAVPRSLPYGIASNATKSGHASSCTRNTTDTATSLPQKDTGSLASATLSLITLAVYANWTTPSWSIAYESLPIFENVTLPPVGSIEHLLTSDSSGQSPHLRTTTYWTSGPTVVAPRSTTTGLASSSPCKASHCSTSTATGGSAPWRTTETSSLPNSTFIGTALPASTAKATMTSQFLESMPESSSSTTWAPFRTDPTLRYPGFKSESVVSSSSESVISIPVLPSGVTAEVSPGSSSISSSTSSAGNDAESLLDDFFTRLARPA